MNFTYHRNKKYEMRMTMKNMNKIKANMAKA